MQEQFAQALEQFFSQYKLRNYRKRDVILHEDDIPTGVYYIKSGYIRLYSVSKAGEELTRLILGPKDLVPLRWVFAHEPIDYYVEPMTDVLAAHCSKDEFIAFVTKNPEILLALTGQIVARMGGLYKRMEDLVFGNAYEKIASILLLYGKRFGKQEGEQVTIQVPLTHRDLASLVGVARETVSLEMERLEKGGFITGVGHLITIQNVKALEKESMVSGTFE